MDHIWKVLRRSGWRRTAVICFCMALLCSPFSARMLHAQDSNATSAGGGAVVGDGTPASCDNNAMRNAIEAGGTVTFNCGAAPITIASDTMVIHAGVTTLVDGGGLITIDGEDLRQPFIVEGGGALTLTNLVLTNGGWFGDGAAIATAGALTLDGVLLSSSSNDANGVIFVNGGTTNILRSTLSGNHASNGGAVYMLDGLLQIRQSTFVDNSATSGGALFLAAGTVVVENSTFSQNRASAVGGAIFSDAYITQGGTSLAHVTLAENTDDAGQNAVHVEGDDPAPLQFQNSLLVATANQSGSLCRTSVPSGIQSDGYNLANSNTCPFTSTGDEIVASLALPPLADNGGPTQTRLPGVGSPARDRIPADACSQTVDQRGILRPQLATCDVGAVEAIPSELMPEQIAAALPTNLDPATPPFYLGDLYVRPFKWPIFLAQPNIEIQRLEVTQGIQEADGSGVTLVAHKRTYVRVHVRKTDGVADPVVGARLWRIVNGVRTGDPLLPSSKFGLSLYVPAYLGGTTFVNDPKVTVKASPDRNVLGDSFFFKLPDAWTAAGSLRIEAEVNPLSLPNAVTESTRADNIMRSTVDFSATPTMYLRLYAVKYKSNNVVYQASESDLKEAEDWIRRAYPIHRLIVKRDVLDMTSQNGLPNCRSVNLQLVFASIFLRAGGIDPMTTRYYGLVTDGNDSKRFMRGCADNIPAFVASGPTGDPGTYLDFSWDDDNDGGSYGDWYMGHELGHDYGRKHVFCNGKEDDTDTAYPMTNGFIGRKAGVDYYWGFDVALKGPVVYPPTWTDVMTYCPNQWPSAYTYEAIRNQLVNENSVAAAEVLGAPIDSLVIQGMVAPGGVSATLGDIYRLTLPQVIPASAASDFSIRLLDGSNNVLATYPFTPRYDTEDPDGLASPGLIVEQVPWPNGLRRIEIRRGAALLTARNVSLNVPVVTITAPAGDATVDAGGLVVSWNASDADGDPLVATVLFSRDNGVSWLSLREHLTATSVTIPLAELAGTTQGKVRVLVSDGANSGQDDSDGLLTVPNQAPVVQIVTPAADATMTIGPALELSAAAVDAETPDLADSAFVWSSSLVGTLGTGRALDVMMTTAGVHTIQLTVTDPDGGATSATRTVTVTADAQVMAASLQTVPSSTNVGATFGDTAVQMQPLAIRNPSLDELAWTATSDVPWLTLSAASGTTPADPLLRVVPTNVGVGMHVGTITVTVAGLPPQEVRVFLTVNGTQTLLPLINR